MFDLLVSSNYGYAIETSFGLWEGNSRITLAANYNETEVDDVGTLNPIVVYRVLVLDNAGTRDVECKII